MGTKKTSPSMATGMPKMTDCGLGGDLLAVDGAARVADQGGLVEVGDREIGRDPEPGDAQEQGGRAAASAGWAWWSVVVAGGMRLSWR